MDKPQPISLDAVWETTTYLPDRTPVTETTDHFATVADYRDGGIFMANYAGSSEWERHHADEVVVVIDGSTSMTLLIDGKPVAHTMGKGEMIIVPSSTWHRFDSPDGVKVMTLTPQPTDHYSGDTPPD